MFLVKLALITFLAASSCSTHTFIGPSGRVVTCTTCCIGNHCTTNCF